MNMPTAPDDPLRKCTLNLYAADCAFLERTIGREWTVLVRQLVKAEVAQRQRGDDQSIRSVAITRRTLGDLG